MRALCNNSGKSLSCRRGARTPLTVAAALFVLLLPVLRARDDSPPFHQAPSSAAERPNPYAADQAQAVEAGSALYAQHCSTRHGRSAEGSGNIPALAHSRVQAATDGELFWLITTGDVDAGMPSFASLPEQQRWQIASYLKTLHAVPEIAAASEAGSQQPLSAPPPVAPFTDFRYQAPGTVRKITPADLPPPFATPSARNAPNLVKRPPDAWPQAPAGFKVGLYADGLAQPRVIRIAPNGDVFVAESGAGRLRVFRGTAQDGKPKQQSIFATTFHRPYGIAFYPTGPDPRWIYVGDTDAVTRFPYRNGDLEARGSAEHVVDLPHGSGHWTRDVRFSRDGKTLFVGVGSASNVDDPDTSPAERQRADILAMDPDGSHLRICMFSRGASATPRVSPSIPTPVSCGARSMSGTASATIWSRIT